MKHLCIPVILLCCTSLSQAQNDLKTIRREQLSETRILTITMQPIRTSPLPIPAAPVPRDNKVVNYGRFVATIESADSKVMRILWIKELPEATQIMHTRLLSDDVLLIVYVEVGIGINMHADVASSSVPSTSMMARTVTVRERDFDEKRPGSYLMHKGPLISVDSASSEGELDERNIRVVLSGDDIEHKPRSWRFDLIEENNAYRWQQIKDRDTGAASTK